MGRPRDIGVGSDLVDLKAVEALPLIERGYTEDWVDDPIMGDFEEVEIALGLKTARTRPRQLPYHPGPLGRALLSGSEGSGRTRDEKAARKCRGVLSVPARRLVAYARSVRGWWRSRCWI